MVGEWADGLGGPVQIGSLVAELPIIPRLLGNEALRQRLGRLARGQGEDRLHPCLVFEGPEGLGKHLSARWLAMVANCTAEPPPCQKCWSCRQIARGEHPDVIEVGTDPERTTEVVSVRQARELVAALGLRPYSARRRFVIIDPADAMNAEAANALLKTFEEPPAGTGFVLVCTAASRLLPTVRSRCQRVRFAPVKTDVLARWLADRPETAGMDSADLTAIARLAEGCPGRALDLALGDWSEWRKSRDALLVALAGRVGDVLAFSEDLTEGDRATDTPRVERVLDVLEHWMRDVMVVISGDASLSLYNADRARVLAAWANSLGAPGVARLVEAIAEARRNLAANVNGRLVLDALLSRVATEAGPARLDTGASL